MKTSPTDVAPIESKAALDVCALPPRLAALAHPARLAILLELSGRHCSCCKDVVASMNLAQSTVSQHLKVLLEAGIISLESERQRSVYRLEREALRTLADEMNAFAERCGQ